jgi:serine phosphatase RsbU (regulator of sigma subunit)/sugar lactone lactonase YvrE
MHNDVAAIHHAPDGVMWFGTRSGVSRYAKPNARLRLSANSNRRLRLTDGNQFVSLTSKDGLAPGWVTAIHRDPDGVMWFGTLGGGVSRYDGKQFITFTTKDGLADNWVWAIHRNPDSALWFGTASGVSRYDGKQFITFTSKDGLAHNYVTAIHCDPDGVMWFGTQAGVSRYDGEQFVSLTSKDGLAHSWVTAIHRAPDGVMWFGTLGGGVSRYDGKKFITFTSKDGLAHNDVRLIFRDRAGVLWFGTESGGVSCYDGIAWAALDTRDGLAGNIVRAIHQDSDGFLWFGTEGGITRYGGTDVPPKVGIVSVTTDQTYHNLSHIPAFTIKTRVTIKYNAIDLVTVPEKRQYRIRLAGIDADPNQSRIQSNWRPPTKETFFDYTFKEPGTYTFDVQAIDRDLNYSEPASLILTVVPPFYLRASFLAPTVVGGTMLLVVSILLATAFIKHRRRIQAYQQEAVQELQDAQKMQLSLLPETAPLIEGFDIAGKSIPANTVGGDFFDYLSLRDGKIGIALADVSGKGLKGAMNAVLANGMLDEIAKSEASCGNILLALNAALYPRMEKMMFAAFGFAILEPESDKLQWANAAQPYPMVKRDEQVFDFNSEGGLPLGMMPRGEYVASVLELQAGDVVIFYTDGLIEAENKTEEMYGTERLEQLITQIDSTMNGEEMIKTILQDVAAFVGEAEQYDDMTVVVVKRNSRQQK